MQRVEAGDRAGLAEAVPLEQRDADVLVERLEHLQRQWRGAAHANTQRHAWRHLHVGQRAVKLRDRRQDGRLVAQQLADDVLGRMQRLDRHDRQALCHWQQHAHGHAEAVKHRQQTRHAILRRQFQFLHHSPDISQQVVVAEHRALRLAGGAGGVNDQRQVLARLAGRWQLGRLAVVRLAKLLHLDHGQAVELRLERRRALGHRRLADEHLGPGVFEDVADLVRREEIIDRHHDALGQQNAEEGEDKLRAILQPKAHPIAGLQAEFLLEPLGQATGQAVRLAKCDLLVAPENSCLVSVGEGVFGESVR